MEDMEDGVDLAPPERPAGLDFLPSKTLKSLRSTGECTIQPADLRLLMANEDIGLTRIYQRRGPFHLYDDGTILILTWGINERVFKPFLKIRSWEELSGDVRNQLNHILCWAYSAADLVSALRRIRGLADRFIPLCTWFLNTYVDPQMLGQDETARPGHYCYGSRAIDALEFICNEGVPSELSEHRDFDCTREPPSRFYPKTRIDSYLTLKEALDHSHIQPIGATLLDFTGLWSLAKDEIYYGPLTPGSRFIGYHGVIIVAIQTFEGEVVAKCKSSNGTLVGDGGYFRVSLRTMYMVLGVGQEMVNSVRGTPTPQHLLSYFSCPVYNVAPRKRKWLPPKQYKQSKKKYFCGGHGQDELDSQDVPKKKRKTAETVIPKKKGKTAETVVPKKKKKTAETVGPKKEKKTAETVVPKKKKKTAETVGPKKEKKTAETVVPKKEKKTAETVVPKKKKKTAETVVPKEEQKTAETVVPKKKRKTAETVVPKKKKTAEKVVPKKKKKITSG